MTRRLIALASSALLSVSTVAAHASTIYLNDDLTTPVAVNLGGQGFGTTFTVLTVQASTSPESGCIGVTGGATLTEGSGACGGEKTLEGTGTLVTGGDEANPLGNPKQAAPTLAQLGVTNANQVGIIWNGGSPGSANLDIPDVSIKLYDGSDNLLLVVSDAFTGLDPYPGQGNSGWLITMDSTAQAQFNSLISSPGTYYLAMDSTFSWPSGSGGSAESYQLVQLTGSRVTPEPSSLFLLGTGILGAGLLVRRRMHATAKA